MLSVGELLNRSLPSNQWVHLAEVVGLLRETDPDFSATNYGHEKLLYMLQDQDCVEIEKDDSHQVPTYKCKLLAGGGIDVGGMTEARVVVDKFTGLFTNYKDHPPSEVFAYFGWNEENGENYDTPFERLARKAQGEQWSFLDSGFAKKGSQYPILRNYLNFTFLRAQDQGKIKFNSERSKAFFNTGLTTVQGASDIYAVFNKNRYIGSEVRSPWRFFQFMTNFDITELRSSDLPDIVTYTEESSDLIFDTTYDIECNYEHIVEDNNSRLPDIYRDSPRLVATTAIKGAIEGLKERVRRNYKLAVPQWYNGSIQLLLPLNLTSLDKPDLALVAEKDTLRKLYRIRTALTIDMAYQNARLIVKPDNYWLNP